MDGGGRHRGVALLGRWTHRLFFLGSDAGGVRFWVTRAVRVLPPLVERVGQPLLQFLGAWGLEHRGGGCGTCCLWLLAMDSWAWGWGVGSVADTPASAAPSLAEARLPGPRLPSLHLQEAPPATTAPSILCRGPSPSGASFIHSPTLTEKLARTGDTTMNSLWPRGAHRLMEE